MRKTPLIKEIQKGLIAWYDFRHGSSILYVGEKMDAIAEHLMKLSGTVYDEQGKKAGPELKLTVASLENTRRQEFIDEHKEAIDYIICVEKLERETDPAAVLNDWRSLLREGGVCLLGMNNRFGIRFFCGDRDPYTERNFDGIEDYRRAYMKREDRFTGRCYAKFEIEKMLDNAGFRSKRFYSVLSNLQNPALLFEYGYKIKEDLANRVFPAYGSPETVFLEEEPLYFSLLKNDMFHQMANAYFIEASPEAGCDGSNVLQVTSSMERSAEDAMVTIIRNDGTVEKRCADPEGHKRLEDICAYTADLKSHGVDVVDIEMRESGIVMPYVDAPTGQLYLKELLKTDKEAFLKAMDNFRDQILKSSEVVGGSADDELGLTLQYGYVDMVPLNSFFADGHFVFFDQEFRLEKYPANAIITRMIATFYAGNSELEKTLPRDELYERYGLLSRKSDWLQMEWRFLGELRNEGELFEYHKETRRTTEIVNSNRQSINYPAGEYYRLFVDIFNNADTRKLILFGSGRFAERFMDLYGDDYPPFAIVDNNEKRWGEKLGEVKIQSPALLERLGSGEYKVIICIKNYTSVMKQLKTMGVSEYSVYDPAVDYPRKRKPISGGGAGEEDTGPRKYHTGYISGVFDLFHVGHVNLFKKAKEQCDYLIVGVVSDKGVIKHKGVAPFVPFEERLKMVQSCRYVDEAVGIPVDLNGPKEAWPMYHYDVQFLGSDYINNPYWLDNQKWLREHGSDLVFFPYTKSTNSTSLKELIEKKLI